MDQRYSLIVGSRWYYKNSSLNQVRSLDESAPRKKFSVCGIPVQRPRKHPTQPKRFGIGYFPVHVSRRIVRPPSKRDRIVSVFGVMRSVAFSKRSHSALKTHLYVACVALCVNKVPGAVFKTL
jgi:hypothetical protein